MGSRKKNPTAAKRPTRSATAISEHEYMEDEDDDRRLEDYSANSPRQISVAVEQHTVMNANNVSQYDNATNSYKAHSNNSPDDISMLQP